MSLDDWTETSAPISTQIGSLMIAGRSMGPFFIHNTPVRPGDPPAETWNLTQVTSGRTIRSESEFAEPLAALAETLNPKAWESGALDHEDALRRSKDVLRAINETSDFAVLDLFVNPLSGQVGNEWLRKAALRRMAEMRRPG